MVKNFFHQQYVFHIMGILRCTTNAYFPCRKWGLKGLFGLIKAFFASGGGMEVVGPLHSHDCEGWSGNFLPSFVVQWKMVANVKGNDPIGDIPTFFIENQGSLGGWRGNFQDSHLWHLDWAFYDRYFSIMKSMAMAKQQLETIMRHFCRNKVCVTLLWIWW